MRKESKPKTLESATVKYYYVMNNKYFLYQLKANNSNK